MKAAPALSGSVGPATTEPVVKVEGVEKVFRAQRKDASEVRALAPVTFSVAQGEFLALLGPSGCGKSTLLSIIAGLERPSAGRVVVEGQVVAGPHPDLGVVFQKDLLLPWRTALENVLLQSEIRRIPKARAIARARDLFRLVGLSGFEDSYPHELSGGMRQRVGISRAILHNPSLLLMDEPFAALDALTRDQLSVDFDDLWQQARRTVVFVTHNISEAVFLADRIMVMTPRPGNIAATIDINLPRPRDLSIRETAEFAGYAARVREIFEQQGVLRRRGQS